MDAEALPELLSLICTLPVTFGRWSCSLWQVEFLHFWAMAAGRRDHSASEGAVAVCSCSQPLGSNTRMLCETAL